MCYVLHSMLLRCCACRAVTALCCSASEATAWTLRLFAQQTQKLFARLDSAIHVHFCRVSWTQLSKPL